MVTEVFVVAIIIFALLPLVSYVLVRIMKIPIHQRGIYMFMTVFSNIGFMGFPIMKAIFCNDVRYEIELIKYLRNKKPPISQIILTN